MKVRETTASVRAVIGPDYLRKGNNLTLVSSINCLEGVILDRLGLTQRRRWVTLVIIPFAAGDWPRRRVIFTMSYAQLRLHRLIFGLGFHGVKQTPIFVLAALQQRCDLRALFANVAEGGYAGSEIARGGLTDVVGVF